MAEHNFAVGDVLGSESFKGGMTHRFVVDRVDEDGTLHEAANENGVWQTIPPNLVDRWRLLEPAPPEPPARQWRTLGEGPGDTGWGLHSYYRDEWMFIDPEGARMNVAKGIAPADFFRYAPTRPSESPPSVRGWFSVDEAEAYPDALPEGGWWWWIERDDEWSPDDDEAPFSAAEARLYSEGQGWPLDHSVFAAPGVTPTHVPASAGGPLAAQGAPYRADGEAVPRMPAHSSAGGGEGKPEAPTRRVGYSDGIEADDPGAGIAARPDLAHCRTEGPGAYVEPERPTHWSPYADFDCLPDAPGFDPKGGG